MRPPRNRKLRGGAARAAACLLLLGATAPLACGDNRTPGGWGNDERAQPERERPAARTDQLPTTPPPRATLIKHGARDERRVALTFDADMTAPQLAQIEAGSASSSWYDERIVDYLERTRTRATIFLSGLWVKAHPEPARRLARSPLFELENHSRDHVAFEAPCFGLEVIDSKRRKRAEVTESSEMIEAGTGERPRYFRFPGGCHSQDDLRLVARAGEQPLGWDVISGDVGQPDADAVVRAVLDGVKPGSIVVMHLVGEPNAPATAEALEEIVPGLRERGYSFVTLEELLGPSSGSASDPGATSESQNASR